MGGAPVNTDLVPRFELWPDIEPSNKAAFRMVRTCFYEIKHNSAL
jgi:hypothetical protein